MSNEMVSLGDTAISLHILQPPTANWGMGGVLESQNPKCQNLTKFQFLRGGEGSWKVKIQSAKIWLNFNFQRGGCFEKSKPKVPRSGSISVGSEDGGGGGSGTKFQNRGVLSNLVKKFWKPSWPLHHR